VRFLGISEAGPQTIRRAHATHQMSAMQIEYSLWSREVESEILPLCSELGIGFVAYSPLGRGFLTGTVSGREQLRPGDARLRMPRFQADNLSRNLELVVELRRLADAEGCTPAQLALAWVLSRGRTIVPIAGTSHRHWLEDNAAAAEMHISPQTAKALDQVFRHARRLAPDIPICSSRRSVYKSPENSFLISVAVILTAVPALFGSPPALGQRYDPTAAAAAICRQYVAAARYTLPQDTMYAQCMYARGYVVPGFSPSPDSPGYQGELPGPGAIGGGH
jgi:hypothetical protein